MKVNKYTIILSILVGIITFIVFFTKKDTIYFILGCAWICITIEEYIRIKKKDKN